MSINKAIAQYLHIVRKVRTPIEHDAYEDRLDQSNDTT